MVFPSDNLGYNPSAANTLVSAAQAQAQAAYQQGMLKFQNDQLAFQMAQQAYTDAMSMGQAYGYAPSGNYFGWSTGNPPNLTQPLPGTPTQAALSQQFQQAQAAAGLTGQFVNPQQFMYQPGTFIYSDPAQGGSGEIGQVQANGQIRGFGSWDQFVAAGGSQDLVSKIPHLGGSQYQQFAQVGQGQPQTTLAAQQQQFQQGLETTQQQFQQGLQTAQFGLSVQQQQQQAAQQYLSLLSNLQGPADYGNYLKVLGSTPAGLQDLVGAAAGRYMPGGGTTGQAPQAQTLQNLVGAATGQAGGGTGANAATTGDTSGGGAASPGGMNYQDYMATAQGLPAPSQLAPQSYNAMTASQKAMLGGMFSNLGYSPMDVQSLYASSLPKYAAGSAAGNMRLV
jgi:hypothetical protein